MIDEQCDKIVNAVNAFSVASAIGRCAIVITIIAWGGNKAHGTDLQPSLMHVGRSPIRAPELCLQQGREPWQGQILTADKTCPSGLRWRFQK